jgi:hypothetical protein
MAETVIGFLSVLLKIKPLSKSTHIKQTKERWLKEIKIITCTSIEVCLETIDKWKEQLALKR